MYPRVLQFLTIILLNFLTLNLLDANSTATTKPLASCIVNLCSTKPCYFQIDWGAHTHEFDLYTTQYRNQLCEQEINDVHHVNSNIGDNADIIQVRLGLPWNKDQWPLLAFSKSNFKTETKVYLN